MADRTSRSIKVFLSYAHEDEALQKEFSTHLGALKREGIIEVWWDSQIYPGSEWNAEIARELDTADLIVLLVSPAFLDSVYCYDKEMRRAVQRHEAGMARVVPIIVRDCYWQPAPFAKLQGLPKGMKPVTARPKQKRDAVWAEVAKDIHQAAKACSVLQKKICPDFMVFRDAQSAPEMVVLPVGKFLMGQDDIVAAASEKPQHRVHFAYRLAVSQYPITFDEWDAYVADGRTDYRPDDQGWGYGRRPVIHVSWYDAKQYVTWLSQKTGQAYRLLSEAEWEYAARAGTTMRCWWGNEITPQNANYEDSKISKTTEVGSYPASPFKLYDMIGNVWEWVEDCWNESYDNAPEQGEAWTTGDCSRRVLRGGSWKNGWWCVRSACRGSGFPDTRANDVGFRVARTF